MVKDNSKNMNIWKQEQISYFRRYLNEFPADSKEYAMILHGIKELEKHS